MLHNSDSSVASNTLIGVPAGVHHILLFNIEGDSGLPGTTAAIDATIEDFTDGEQTHIGIIILLK